MDENTPLIDREGGKCSSHGHWRLPLGTLRQKGMDVSIHYGLGVKEWPCRPKEQLDESQAEIEIRNKDSSPQQNPY